jgi:hypothetical protein
VDYVNSFEDQALPLHKPIFGFIHGYWFPFNAIYFFAITSKMTMEAGKKQWTKLP